MDVFWLILNPFVTYMAHQSSTREAGLPSPDNGEVSNLPALKVTGLGIEGHSICYFCMFATLRR